MITAEKWFSTVDKNADLKIDVNELSAHLKKLSFTGHVTFFNKLQSNYEAYKK